MEQHSLLASPLMPLIIMSIPVIIFNVSLAKRKGRSPFLYGVLAFIPLFGFFSTIYLSSLTDWAIEKRIYKILDLLEAQQQHRSGQNKR